MLEKLEKYINTLDIDSISEDRIAVLKPLQHYVKERQARKEDINLTFICTHNSRRSHFGQVWAKVAADYYGVKSVNTFSGGTEATACNPRTISSLSRAGFQISSNSKDINPKYTIVYHSSGANSLTAFSKVYDAEPNPKRDFAAIMTCDHADADCPFIPGADARIPVLYIDPKVADDSPLEEETYDERCKQIATEMFWVFGVF